MFTHPQTIWHPETKIFVVVLFNSCKLAPNRQSFVQKSSLKLCKHTKRHFVVANREILSLSQKLMCMFQVWKSEGAKLSVVV